MSSPKSQHVQGNFSLPLSLSPLKEAGKLVNHLADYLEEHRKKYNASVFKIHPGLKTVVCLDHASAEFYFNASQSVLEREELPRFGPLAVRPDLLGGSCPTLLASGKVHGDARAFTDEILRNRDEYLSASFDKVSERMLQKCKSSSELVLWDVLVEWSSNIACNWFFDIDIDMEEAREWLNNSTTIDTDTFLTKIIGKSILPKCSRAAVETQAKMKKLLEGSPLFTDYVKLAEKHNVPTESLTGFFTFLCLFNITGAVTSSLQYAVARIYSSPELKASLKNQLMNANTDQILQNPLLDNVFYEVLRLNAVPRVYFKKAKCDFSMPAADGKFYDIKEDDLVLIPTTISHRDPKVFDDPDNFDPYRFERDPSLKNKVFGYGISNKSKNSYGCAAKKHQAAWVWKKILATFITKVDFEFTEEPTFNFNSYCNFYPRTIGLESISVDGKSSEDNGLSQDASGDGSLKKRFSVMANKVRNKEVEFSKKDYLQLYGLYKQAITGDNTTPVPNRLKVLTSEKWVHWNRLKGTSKTESMVRYVELASGEKISLEDSSKNTVQKEKPAVEQKIQVTYDAGCQQQLMTEASFFIEADAPDVLSELELEINLIGNEKDSGRIKVLIPKGSDATEVRWSTPIPMIGEPQIIELSITPSDAHDLGSWLIKKIEIRLDEVGLSYFFLSNSHITIPSAKNIFFEATGRLPKAESQIQKDARKFYLEHKRNIYKWRANHSLPGVVDFADFGDIPLGDQFQTKSFSTKAIEPQENEERPVSFEYYLEKVKLNNRDIPRLANDNKWMQDEEFGRLYLQGAHCNFLRRCTELPTALNAGLNFLDAKSQRTLQELIEDKLLYICDYEILSDSVPTKGFYSAAPIVLFYSDTTNQSLLPIAIQIERDKEAPVFIPDDAFNDWLLAKMWARVADISAHQLSSHFALTHGVLEAYAVAALRTLSPTHPLFQLLMPHFKHTLCINTLARSVLVNEGGWIDNFSSFGVEVKEKVMQRTYQQASLKTYMNFPRDLKHRGVDDLQCLPSYPYRDDGLLIWEAIKEYVENILNIYYKNDEDVAQDSHLDEWLSEFESNGYVHSDWGEIKTLDDLKDLLTSLIFSATALHGAMNTMQYEVYGFVPNSPVAMLRRPIREKGVTSQDDIVETLPAHHSTLIFLFLSETFDEDIKLAGNKFIYSNDTDFRQVFLRFKMNLQHIESLVNERNHLRKVPYISMLPSRIPNSVDL